VLADGARPAEHRAIKQALVDLESNAVGPLLGALQSDDAALKAQAAAVLAALEVREAVPWLLGLAHREQGTEEQRRAASAAIARLVGRSPSREEAIALLRQFALKYYQGGRPGVPDPTGQVLVWDWDAEKKQSVERLMPAEDAGWLYALRLSRDLYALSPQDTAAHRMYLASLLQFESYRQGLDKPLPEGEGSVREAAAALGGAAVLDVMSDSMAAGRIPAATACARLLSELGSAELLEPPTAAGETAIVRAAQHPDRRLRFAALETILKWDPRKRYAGSSGVAASLAFLAASNGKLQAVLVDTLPGSASRLAGFLAELDYDPKVVGTGRDLVKQAIASPDVALVIVDARLAGVGADQIVQQLRADSRTASVPIAFLRDVDYPESAEKLARKHAPAIVLSRPSTTEEMKFQLDILLRETGRQYVLLAERQRQAQQCLAWLAALSTRTDGIYDLRPFDRTLDRGLYNAATSAGAAEVLAAVGTPFGQQSLVEHASNLTAPIDQRRIAAAALAKSVDRYGVLLTTAEIQRQYDRYNASRDLDKETQDVLGSLLDAIESRWKKEDEGAKKAVR
jgi:CheY-like chemotaxis protein